MKLEEYGLQFGYFPKACKSHLIVKDAHLEKANQQFAKTEINITTTGQRHLGTVIGSQQYKDQFITDKVAK